MFYKDYYDKHQEEFRNIATFGQYSQVISEQWKKLDEETKIQYYKRYDQEKEQHRVAFKKYINSPEYKQYQLLKQKIEQRVQKEENDEYHMQKATASQQPSVRKYFLQSFKDITDDFDSSSIKKLSSINFATNKCLMEKIFDGVLLSEVEQLHTTAVDAQAGAENVDETLEKIGQEIELQMKTLADREENNNKHLEMIRATNQQIRNDFKSMPEIFSHMTRDSYQSLKSLTNEELQRLKAEVNSLQS